MPERKIFASAQDVETAFYEALERADINAMMAVWAEDEDVELFGGEVRQRHGGGTGPDRGTSAVGPGCW